MNARSLGIALVFVAGCAVGGVSSQLVVPKANAQQAASLTRWEYLCINDEDAAPETTVVANKLGAEGWELATNSARRYCFKRPKL